jgi:hypothetical protein
MHYQVIDRRTQQVVGTYTTLIRAHNAAGKKDLEHGSSRYKVRRVEVAV